MYVRVTCIEVRVLFTSFPHSRSRQLAVDSNLIFQFAHSFALTRRSNFDMIHTNVCYTIFDSPSTHNDWSASVEMTPITAHQMPCERFESRGVNRRQCDYPYELGQWASAFRSFDAHTENNNNLFCSLEIRPASSVSL